MNPDLHFWAWGLFSVGYTPAGSFSNSKQVRKAMKKWSVPADNFPPSYWGLRHLPHFWAAPSAWGLNSKSKYTLSKVYHEIPQKFGEKIHKTTVIEKASIHLRNMQVEMEPPSNEWAFYSSTVWKFSQELESSQRR